MSSILCTMFEREIIADRNKHVTTFGEKLRVAMESKLGGSKAPEIKILAEATDINASLIYKWLAGRKPEPSNVVKLADYFGDGNPEGITLWLHAAEYPMAIRLYPDAEEQQWISLRRNFPWLDQAAPELVHLPPIVRQAVIDLIRSLNRLDRDTAQ